MGRAPRRAWREKRRVKGVEVCGQRKGRDGKEGEGKERKGGGGKGWTEKVKDTILTFTFPAAETWHHWEGRKGKRWKDKPAVYVLQSEILDPPVLFSPVYPTLLGATTTNIL